MGIGVQLAPRVSNKYKKRGHLNSLPILVLLTV